MNTMPTISQPRLLQTLQWILRPCQFMERCHAAHGDFFELDIMGLGRVALISDPDTVAEIFRASPQVLRTGEANALVTPLLGPSSLLAIDAPEHPRVRRLVAPAFQRSAIAPHLVSIAKFTGDLEDELPKGTVFPLLPHLRRLTLRVMLTMLFGNCDRAKLDTYVRAFAPATGELVAALAYLTPLQRDLGPLSPGGWFRRTIDSLDRLLAGEIERCNKLQQPDCVLASMIRASSESGTPLSNHELRDQLMTLLAAGHETVASAIAWAMYWVHTEPRFVSAIRSEGPERGEFTRAACQESLRLSSVVESVSRVAAQPMVLGGFSIEKGVLVSPATHLVHHRPDIYPEPHRFKPERFLGRRYRAHEYFPFGGGQRHCIGSQLALEEMTAVVGQLVRKFDLRLAESAPPRPVRRNVTIAPDSGTRIEVIRRLH